MSRAHERPTGFRQPAGPAPTAGSAAIKTFHFSVEDSDGIACATAAAEGRGGTPVAISPAKFFAGGNELVPNYTLTALAGSPVPDDAGASNIYMACGGRSTDQAANAPVTFEYRGGPVTKPTDAAVTVPLSCPALVGLPASLDFTTGFSVTWSGSALAAGETLGLELQADQYYQIPVTVQSPTALQVAPQPDGAASRPPPGRYSARLVWTGAASLVPTSLGITAATAASCASNSVDQVDVSR